MCLAVPGQLVEWIERESPFAEGVVEFAGVRRRTNLACVPEAVVGDFVLVHAGVAISRIDADEAQRILRTLEEIEFDQPPFKSEDSL
ncbi:MAG: HypC/HybG/HupF family hydrogenase formation chaperone [Planctomycetaceae bacterium]|nr:HypC/HybG/HupF family hydrogenase formation chaperone [Planctomycetales bacterium]MCB9936652.1 HypC/HybG/HupF family hydrogenase formation chaperone [Planctomycetaceae bacterium]